MQFAHGLAGPVQAVDSLLAQLRLASLVRDVERALPFAHQQQRRPLGPHKRYRSRQELQVVWAPMLLQGQVHEGPYWRRVRHRSAQPRGDPVLKRE